MGRRKDPCVATAQGRACRRWTVRKALPGPQTQPHPGWSCSGQGDTEEGLGLGQMSPPVVPQLGCGSPVRPVRLCRLLAVTTDRQAVAAGPSLYIPLHAPGGSRWVGRMRGARRAPAGSLCRPD